MEQLPVEKFHGVGRVTAEKMKKMGLYTGADLKKLPEEELVRSFGKAGRFYYRIVRGIDEREVQPHRETKSLAAEDTFPIDLTSMEEMESELDKIAVLVYNRLQKNNLKGRTITLKIKYSDFKLITRNRSFAASVNDLHTISETAKGLLAAAFTDGTRVRLLGISISNFGNPEGRKNAVPITGQLTLF